MNIKAIVLFAVVCQAMVLGQISAMEVQTQPVPLRSKRACRNYAAIGMLGVVGVAGLVYWLKKRHQPVLAPAGVPQPAPAAAAPAERADDNAVEQDAEQPVNQPEVPVVHSAEGRIFYAPTLLNNNRYIAALWARANAAAQKLQGGFLSFSVEHDDMAMLTDDQDPQRFDGYDAFREERMRASEHWTLVGSLVSKELTFDDANSQVAGAILRGHHDRLHPVKREPKEHEA